MAYGKPEKICPHMASGGYRRALKRAARRTRRQQERRNPENAPRKLRYYGWSI